MWLFGCSGSEAAVVMVIKEVNEQRQQRQGSHGSFMARTEHKDTLIRSIAGIWMGTSVYSSVVSLEPGVASLLFSLSPNFAHPVHRVMFTEHV